MPERKSARVVPLKTTIVVDSVESDHPYCTWPAPEGMGRGSDDAAGRTLFAVQTWDGRELLAVDVTRTAND